MPSMGLIGSRRLKVVMKALPERLLQLQRRINHLLRIKLRYMAFLWLLLGLVLLFLSGNWLIKGSVALSRRFKVSTLVIGLTVVAFGTSAPELFVSVKAAWDGVPDLAVGNVVGSNIANIGLILGLVALMVPIVSQNRGILFDWGVMVLATLLLMYFSYNGTIGFWEGLSFVVALVVYLLWSVWQARRKSARQGETFLPPGLSLWQAVGLIVLAVGGLYLGAEWLVKGAKSLALNWGVSDRVIGISIVAFGTSVPELATSLIAVFRKENDISVGNIIGSNIFNILAVLGVTSLISPLRINDNAMLANDLLISFLFAVLLLVFMLPLKNGRIGRTKGAVLFLGYVLYMYLLYT